MVTSRLVRSPRKVAARGKRSSDGQTIVPLRTNRVPASSSERAVPDQWGAAAMGVLTNTGRRTLGMLRCWSALQMSTTVYKGMRE